MALLFFFLAPTKIKAGEPDWVDTTVCTAIECGTTEGTKNQSKTTPGYNTPVVCDHTCPSVEFSASRQVVDVAAHKEHRHCISESWGHCWAWGDWNDGNGHGSGIKETRDVPATYTTETFGPIAVQYGEKSSDKNHCHRPTGSSLGVPSWAMSEFNGLNLELDTEETNCTGGDWVPEVVEKRTVKCDDAIIITCPSVCGNYEKEDGEECDDGNVTSGDGCSATCQTETSYECKSNVDCEDYNKCTTDTCNTTYACTHEPITTGECASISLTPTPIQQSEPTCEEQVRAGTWRGEHECGWSPKPWEQGAYAPASCGGIYTDPPLLQHFVRVSPTEVELKWWKPVGGVDRYSLVYGYKETEMIHGIIDIPSNSTGITIGALRPNTYTFFQLWAFKNNCVTKSNIIDP